MLIEFMVYIYIYIYICAGRLGSCDCIFVLPRHPPPFLAKRFLLLNEKRKTKWGYD